MTTAFNETQIGGIGFDLFRLTKSKETVDISPNTLRDYNRRGLKFYRSGKPVFVSKTELAAFIRDGGPSRPRKGEVAS